MMVAIGQFRSWLKHNVPFARFRDDPNNNYVEALELLIELWDMADERAATLPPIPPFDAEKKCTPPRPEYLD